MASADGAKVVRAQRIGRTPHSSDRPRRHLLDDLGGNALGGFDRPGRAGAGPVTVFLVGAGPGDPGLLTRRGAALLARPAWSSTTASSTLRCSPCAGGGPPPRRRALHRPGGPSGLARQDAINALLLEHGRTGAVVVRLKGGDPFLFAEAGRRARRSATPASPSRWSPA